MMAKIFIDTNLWVYLYGKNPEHKYLKVKEIIVNNFDSIVISTQILGELFYVLSRKKLVEEDQAKKIILEIVSNFSSIDQIDTAKVLKALEINSKYGYSYWDSLIIATALLNDCVTIYSEDMHHDQLIEKKTRIINLFYLP